MGKGKGAESWKLIIDLESQIQTFLRISSLRIIIHLMSNVMCSSKFVELNCGIFIRILPFVAKHLILSFCFD